MVEYGQVKITQLGMARRVQEYVLQLHVPVGHPDEVHLCQSP